MVSACATFAILLAWEKSHNRLPTDMVSAIKFSFATSAGKSTAPPPPVKLTPGPAPTEAFFIHQVAFGETFESIAEQYNMSAEELVSVNGFEKIQPLGEGEVLRIPVQPQGIVLIDSVIGPGDLETEKVLLKHQSQGELSLAGWQLEEENGSVYVFPAVPNLTLFDNGAVYIHTGAGTDSVIDIYWGLTAPVWQSGDTVILRDDQGNIRDTYPIP